jgi:hypothetical protein
MMAASESSALERARQLATPLIKEGRAEHHPSASIVG